MFGALGYARIVVEISLPSRSVGQPSIAEVGCNGRAVAALDAGTAALQPCQPSVVALVPPCGLLSDGSKRHRNRDCACRGGQGHYREQVGVDHFANAELPFVVIWHERH